MLRCCDAVIQPLTGPLTPGVTAATPGSHRRLAPPTMTSYTMAPPLNWFRLPVGVAHAQAPPLALVARGGACGACAECGARGCSRGAGAELVAELRDGAGAPPPSGRTGHEAMAAGCGRRAGH